MATIIEYFVNNRQWSKHLQVKGRGYWFAFWAVPVSLHIMIAFFLTTQVYSLFSTSGFAILLLYALDFIWLDEKINTGWRKALHLFALPLLQVFFTAIVFLTLR
jgi:hypothetical protein